MLPDNGRLCLRTPQYYKTGLVAASNPSTEIALAKAVGKTLIAQFSEYVIMLIILELSNCS